MNVHPLTPIEYRIVEEICCLLARHGDGSAAIQNAISILGRWGESMCEENILRNLESINQKGAMWEELRARHPGLEVKVEADQVWLRFRSPDGSEAYINAEEMAAQMGALGQHAILTWASSLRDRNGGEHGEA